MTLAERFWRGFVIEDDAPSQTFFFEVVPSVGFELPPDDVFTYARREALTRAALAEVVPPLLEAVRLDPAEVQTQVGPGGYKLVTNPSIQAHVTIGDARARVVAAALGWVFRQWSVLVGDLRDSLDGKTGYVVVDLGPEPLAAARAHDFFLHAASVEMGLGEGYTAFAHDLLFLNFSDLDDGRFTAALGAAAAGFPGARPTLGGQADARLIENDWDRAPEGQEYLRLLDGVDRDALTRLRARHTRLVEEALRG